MKKALSAVLAVVLVLGVCFSVPMIASANDTDPFTYELDNAQNPTGYIITGVKQGVEGAVQIPATYQPAEDFVLFPPTDPEQQAAPEGSYDITTVAVDGEDATIEDATITLTVEETSVTYAEPNDVVKVTAEKEGYEVVSITVTETEGATAVEFNTVEGTFTMPEAAVTVTVVFEEETPAPATYTVTIDDGDVDGCSVDASKSTEIASGENVVLTINVTDGYELASFTVDGVDRLAEAAEGTYTIENITADVAVVATFTAKAAPKFAITDCTVDGKGSATATVDEAAAGDPVTVEVTEEEGYALKTLKYKYNDGEEKSADITKGDAGYSFTMPAYAVTIEADFVEVFAITGVNTATGKVTASVAEAEAGATVTLTVDPEDGYQLVANSLKVNNGDVTVTDNTFTMPAAAVTVTAEFEAIEYKAEVATGIINGKVEATAKRGETAITDLEKLNIGDTVTLTLTIDKGCELKADTLQVSYTDGEGTKTVALTTVEANKKYTFSMPAANVTISAQIIPSELDVVGIAADAFQGENAANITAFTVHADQTRFVAENGVLFEKVAGTDGAPDTLKLIAFPAAYVATNEAKTYTIPATVNGLAVTAVADGAFQALGNVEYVFCADEDITSFDKHPAFYTTEGEGEEATKDNNKKLHLGMTAHTKDAGTTVAATCKVAGATTFKCTVCSVAMPEETIVLPIVEDAHTYGAWVTTTPATCLLEGVEKRTCTNEDAQGVCGHVETQLIPATGTHVAGEGTVTTEATCTSEGVMTFYCTGCKTEVVKTETIDALGHEISDPDVVVKATCTEDGYVEGICDNCNTKQRIDEAKKGHTMITVVDAEATCTVAGSQHEECKTCGYMDEDAVIGTIPALGHSKAEETAWTIVTEATCAEAGLLQKFCDTCRAPLTDKDGKEITRVLEATGEHEYKDYTVTKAPTCTEKGEKTGTCACGATDVQEVAALGHEFATEFTEDEAATCTKVGSKSKHCTRTGCQEKSEVTEIPVIAHTLADDAEVTTEATCHSKGVKTGKCTVCEKTDATVEIPMKDHTWAETAVPVVGTITKENVPVLDEETGEPVLDEETGEPEVETVTYKAATCEAEGYTVKYCTVENCGAYDEASLTKVAKLEHNFVAYPQGVTASTKVNPTCTTEGREYKYCDRTCCAKEIEIIIPANGHDWATSATVLTQSITVTDEDGKETTYNAPSCKGEGTDGYKAVFCTVAGCDGCKDFEVVKAPAHVPEFTQWTAGTAATCLKKATETNVCVNCDDPLVREVGELADHDFSETKTTVYPTCEEDGVEYYACKQAGCKARNQEKVLEALGHDHADDAEFVGTEATCLTDGVKVKACTRLFNADGSLYEAPKTEEPTTPDEGDDEGTEGDSTTPATVAEGDANEGGETPTIPEGVVACEGLKQVTKATGHAFSDEYTVDTEPTCTEEGVKSRHCTNKGCTEKTGAIKVKALGHEYGETYTVDTKATCSSIGYESIHCTRYDDCETKKTGSTREIPKSEHTYSDTAWKTVTAPTCEEEGVQENFCTVCNEDKEVRVDKDGKPIDGYTTRETAARGHSWAMDYVTVEATCTTDGETYLPCERSGCKGKSDVTVLPKTGHDWATESDTNIPELNLTEDDEPEVEVTCTTDGYEYKYCKTCKVWIGGVVEAEGHKYSTTPTRVEPTCHSTGSLTGECSVCKATNAVQVLPKLDHTWGDWELVEDATDCTAEDSMIRACTVEECNATELGENEEHTVSSWIIGTKATCGTAGEMHTECKVCAKVIETEAIAATGKHDLKETITTAPTCIDAGEKTVECQAEGCTYTDTVVIPANGHSYTEWKVFVEPTCTTKGIRQSVCEVCLTTQSEKILALGHDLGQYIVDAPAVCGKAGSQHKECSRCDYKTEAEPIAALEHNFVGNDCANKCGAKIYEYALVEGSTTDIIITKYNGSDENLVIPAVIDDYNVVAIGDRAFMKTVIHTTTTEVEGEDGETTTETTTTVEYVESDFTSLTIPASIAKIGDYAFANSKLTLVNIPATVTTIGKCAFGYDVVITMVPDLEEGETPADGEEVEYVENIAATQVVGFTIYGVKDSAAETYAKQDAAEDEEYNFTFVEVADVYDVVIDEEETNIVEVDNGVLFKEFAPVVENDDSTKIVNQIKAVIELPENSTYTVDVEATLSGVINEGEDDETPYAFYGTGSKILIKDVSGNVVDEIVVIIEGDVNGDSVVDAIDCMLIQLATKDAEVLDGVYYTAGNITADSAITADDLNQAVLKIFGEDLVVEKEEETTVTTTAAPTTEATTEPTTQAPASTEPSTEGTSESTTQAPAESTTQAPAESTTQAPAESTTQTPAESTTQTSGEAA